MDTKFEFNNKNRKKTAVEHLIDCSFHISRPRRIEGYNIYFQPLQKSISKWVLGYRGETAIFDMNKIITCLRSFLGFVKELSKQDGKILFVCNTPELKPLVREIAKYHGHFYVCDQWGPGLLTNWSQVRKRILSVKNRENFDRFSPREERRFMKKFETRYGGIVGMKELPDFIIMIGVDGEVFDVKGILRETTHVRIPVGGILDLHVDSDKFTYPIPGNEASLGGLSFILYLISRVLDSGKGKSSEELSKINDFPYLPANSYAITERYGDHKFPGLGGRVFRIMMEELAKSYARKDSVSSDELKAGGIKLAEIFKAYEKIRKNEHLLKDLNEKDFVSND